jgi:hypothetical protein
MARLRAFGMQASPLRGWDGEIYRREVEPSMIGPPASMSGSVSLSGPVVETPTPILHLANFALPADRGDYGGGAVELMGRGGIFISLLEHDHAEAGTALFKGKGIPWPLSAHDFDPQQMQRTISGQAGCQRFFTHGGRAFCLYVAIGSYAMRAVLVGEVNAVLATVSFD